MRIRSRLGLKLAVVALGAAAAFGGVAPESGAAMGTAPPRSGELGGLLTIDEQFAAVARKVPGFAGFHRDPEKGVTYISLRDPSYQAEAEKAIAEIMGWEVLLNRTVVVQPVAYDFLQLEKWYAQLRDHLWQVESVRWTDIDERVNRIAIGVGTVEGKAQLEAIIRRVGVPRPAVIIDLPKGALSEVNPLAGCRTRQKPPQPEERLPFTLNLSDEAVVPGKEIVLTVEGAQQGEVLRGLPAYLECWDGSRWSPRFAMYSEGAGGGPSTEIYNAHSAIPSVGFDGSRPARFKLPDRLSPGWYRIRMHVSTTEGGYYKGHDLWALVRVAIRSGR